jgi:hypothetical protein
MSFIKSKILPRKLNPALLLKWSHYSSNTTRTDLWYTQAILEYCKNKWSWHIAFSGNHWHLQMPVLHQQVLVLWHISGVRIIINVDSMPYLNIVCQYFSWYSEGTALSHIQTHLFMNNLWAIPLLCVCVCVCGGVGNLMKDQCSDMGRLIGWFTVPNGLSWNCTHNLQWHVRTGYNLLHHDTMITSDLGKVYT